MQEPQPLPEATLQKETFYKVNPQEDPSLSFCDNVQRELVLQDPTSNESQSMDMTNKMVSANKDYSKDIVQSDVYYGVLTPSQDDFIYIHHNKVYCPMGSNLYRLW